MMDYQQFLQRKQERHWRHGIETGDVNPTLHDWQQDIVRWACHVGRAAIFADCGLGKSFMQLEWARNMGTSLIVAPLSVARQTIREGQKLGLDVTYSRDGTVSGPLTITNYEMAHTFDPKHFDAVVLDESSILKNVDGKTRRALTEQFTDVEFRLACSATPAPNDVAELTNHAEFLGVMSRVEMLAAYFVHDDDGWRLKGHASGPMFEWMASWAVALRRPSDIGSYSDDGYVLPALHVVDEVVPVEVVPDGQLFATDLGGVGGRAAVRRETLESRVARAVEISDCDEQVIVWCGLNDEASKVAAALDDAVNVEGSWKPEAKAEALEAFQDGNVRVLVTKCSIAGFGMNFQNCRRMVFCGIGDSYESYYQAIRRCWRFGQTKEVYAHVVVSELEQQIVGNVRRKEVEADGMTDKLVREVAKQMKEFV